MKVIVQLLFTLIILLNILITTSQAAESKEETEDICVNAENVAQQNKPESFKTLTEMYKANTNRKELKCIAEYLVQVNETEANDFFIKNLQNEDHNTAARAAYGLSITKDIRAVEPLHHAFNDPESKIKCNVAYTLGAIKDPSSLSLLLPELDSEYPATRRCVIRALKAYKDTNNCQKLYDIWMKDNDELVQIEAGIAVVFDECDKKITRSNEYNVESKYCSEEQALIDKYSEAIVKFPTKKDIRKNVRFDLKRIETEYQKPEEAKIMMNLIMAAMDWTESVDDFNSVKDWGSLEENKKRNFVKIVEYRKKEEAIKHFCPNIEFPDFSFWNQIIQNK